MHVWEILCAICIRRANPTLALAPGWISPECLFSGWSTNKCLALLASILKTQCPSMTFKCCKMFTVLLHESQPRCILAVFISKQERPIKPDSQCLAEYGIHHCLFCLKRTWISFSWDHCAVCLIKAAICHIFRCACSVAAFFSFLF